MGRPSLTPGSYFRCLLIGYLEGIDSERGIAWLVLRMSGLAMVPFSIGADGVIGRTEEHCARDGNAGGILKNAVRLLPLDDRLAFVRTFEYQLRAAMVELHSNSVGALLKRLTILRVQVLRQTDHVLEGGLRGCMSGLSRRQQTTGDQPGPAQDEGVEAACASSFQQT